MLARISQRRATASRRSQCWWQRRRRTPTWIKGVKYLRYRLWRGNSSWIIILHPMLPSNSIKLQVTISALANWWTKRCWTIIHQEVMFLNRNLHCLILEMTLRVMEPQACIRRLATQKRLLEIQSTSSNHLVGQERQDDRWKVLLWRKAIKSNSSVWRTKLPQHWKEQTLWAFNLVKITKPYQFPPSQSKSAAGVPLENELKISKYRLNGRRQRAWRRRYRARASWLNKARETTNKFYRIGKIRIKHHKSADQHQRGMARKRRIK